MIKNKTASILLTITNIIYMFVLTCLKDPFVYNFSMYTNTIRGYLSIFILCILLGVNLANTTYVFNKKYLLIALLGSIIGCIFPFDSANRNLVSNLHELCAYVSFFSVLFITYTNINKFKLYNYKKANILEKIFIIVFVLDGLIYLKLFGVTSAQELILLSTSLLIHLYMYVKTIDL